jgi:hypothetical protein
VVCLRPQDSGKAISRMPEMGCCYWQAQERAEAHPATLPLPPG